MRLRGEGCIDDGAIPRKQYYPRTFAAQVYDSTAPPPPAATTPEGWPMPPKVPKP